MASLSESSSTDSISKSLHILSNMLAQALASSPAWWWENSKPKASLTVPNLWFGNDL